MSQKHRLKRHFFHDARFTGRHLADDRHKDRRTLVRDRSHFHRHIEIFQRHVAVAFAKRPLRLEQLAVDQPFDNDFGISGNIEVDADGFDDPDRGAGKPARHGHFVLVDRKLLRAGKQDDRRATDHDGARHRLFSFLVFSPMQIAAGAARPRRHAHAKTVLRFQRAAIGAHVLHAAFGIAGDAQRRCEIGGGVETRASRSVPATVRDLRRAAADPPLWSRLPGTRPIETTTGGIGFATPCVHAVPMSSTRLPIPMA